MAATKLAAALAALLLCAASAAVTVRQVATTPAEATMEPSMEPSPGPSAADSEPVCFPGAATVALASGARKAMAELAVGDVVQVGPARFSEVFMFTHKLAAVEHDFVVLTTASGHALRATSGHYIYADGQRTAAGAVRVGAALELADGSVSPVVQVAAERAAGLFNPQTVHGDIVVDGVRASTYTTAVEPGFAHAALAPLRSAYGKLGLATTLFDQGARLLAQLTPKGQSVVA